MSSIDPKILKEFQSESKSLVVQLIEILEKCEGDSSQVQRLEVYGQFVDRIMGGAQTLAMLAEDKNSLIHLVGDYSAICKAVGYKASQINGNDAFYDICVSLLLDATEMLNKMIDGLDDPNKKSKDILSKTILERLHWISTQFAENVRASVGVTTEEQKVEINKQEELDQLLKKLGLNV